MKNDFLSAVDLCRHVAPAQTAQNHTCPLPAPELLVQTLLDPSRWSRNLCARPPRFSPTHRYLIPEAQRKAVIDLA